MSEEQVVRWYLNARRKYIWDKATIASYVDLFQEIVGILIQTWGNTPDNIEFLATPDIGFFPIGAKDESTYAYALYILDAGRRNSKFSHFKLMYHGFMGSIPMGDILDEGFVKAVYPSDRAERIITLKKQCIDAGCVKSFTTLANKSLNHRRAVSKRVRYRVLQRDDFTCQSCGRRAPAVTLHVDHIVPVSWGSDWIASDNVDDYQTLCEDCNLGKGDMSWLLNVD